MIMPQGGERLLGRVGQGGDRRGGRDHAVVVGGREGVVALVAVAGGQAPGRAIAAVSLGVVARVGVVDQGMGAVLLEIVGVPVRQPARVEAHEAVMREEERAAEIGAQRQADAVEAFAVLEAAGALSSPSRTRPEVDRMGRRGEAEDEGHQPLVIAGDRQAHGPVVARPPVPHHPVGRGAEGGPVDAVPERVDPGRKRAGAEPLAGGDQAHHQEGRLDDVAAGVVLREGHRLAGGAVHPVREGALVARCL